jgi:anti-sigma regulatory factor (Ser/Thr protein kinase)
MDAFARVPVLSHGRLEKALAFLADFVGMLGEMGLSALLREREQEALKETERRYRHLFDNSTAGLVVFRAERDPDADYVDLVIVDLNPTQARRTQRTREDLAGRRMSQGDGGDARLHAYYDLVAGAMAFGQPSQRELYLPDEEVYEQLTAYPAGRDLWAITAEDVTDVRRAEVALRQQEEDIRQAYVDVLDAVTGGKLILLTDESLGEPLSDSLALDAPAQMAEARHQVVEAAASRYPGIDRYNLISPVCEALENALKHAHGGTYQVFARNGCVQVAITDRGPGIDFRMLPKATLVPGFSTAASLGMGFTIMLQLCERVLLSTRPGRTRVVLEVAAVPGSVPADRPA